MEHITLNGKDYRIAFDFATLMQIEDEFGTGYAEVMGKPKAERSLHDNFLFLYSVLKAANPDMEPFSEWIHTLQPSDMAVLNEAIITAQDKFFYLPPSQQTEPSDSKPEGEKKD